ncbi:MAG: reactive intermediate/imine deaminase [Elusimicrobia bacterium GWA2_69_24]|nr:MAG: reactive intermediate/imine deaminase [Elusimicrobia bacterium GWA2_69_24]HBL17440.1 reactive intermediate/imine deaminase [Elusimicrobiota bacterium]
MKKEAVQTQKAPAAIGPYSQAIRSGGFLFISGQLPLDPVSGAMAAADVAGQTRKALENMGEILRAAGAEYRDVVKTTVFMTDLGRFAEMNGVYAEFFPDTPPARAAVQVSALPKGALVEIEALAALP